MDRLENFGWNKKHSELQYKIQGCPAPTRRDLTKLWNNLQKIATEVSKLEVAERRTMGSSGRAADEKFNELLKQIDYLEKMILIANLSF